MYFAGSAISLCDPVEYRDMENVVETPAPRNNSGGLRRSGVASGGSSLHGHEFREILDTAFQAQSDLPPRTAEVLGQL